MRLKILVALLGLFMSSCGDKNANASSSSIQCKLQISPVEWVADEVCGADKKGDQMLMIGSFKNNSGPRTGCVSLSRFCVIEQ